MPITSYPSRSARKVTARIAGFNPGTSPPPVRIPITPFFTLIFAIMRCSPQCGLAKQKIMDVAMNFRKRQRSINLAEETNRYFAFDWNTETSLELLRFDARSQHSQKFRQPC